MEASLVFDSMPSVSELYNFIRINPETHISGKPLPDQIKKVVNDGPSGGNQVRMSLMNFAGEDPKLCRKMASAAENLGYYVFRETYLKNGKRIESFLIYSKDPGVKFLSPNFSKYDRKNGYVTSFHSTFGQLVIIPGKDEERSLEFLDAYLKMVNKEYRDSFGNIGQKPVKKSFAQKFYNFVHRI